MMNDLRTYKCEGCGTKIFRKDSGTRIWTLCPFCRVIQWFRKEKEENE